MLEKEFLDSIGMLIYYIKRYNVKEQTTEELVRRIKVKVISSKLLKNYSIIKLFEEYTIQEISKSIEDSITKNRFYKYKIISKLLKQKVNIHSE